MIIGQQSTHPVPISAAEDTEEGDKDSDPYLRVPPRARQWQPQISCLLVPGLPRGALVEIQPLACSLEAGAEGDSDSEDDPSPSSQRWLDFLPPSIRCKFKHSSWVGWGGGGGGGWGVHITTFAGMLLQLRH